MTPPWNKDVDRYIGKLEEVHKAFKTYDAHVHPTEVIFGVHSYEERPEAKGLFGLGAAAYRSPSLADFKQGHEEKEANYAAKEYRRILPMMLRRIYSHTGPKVFGDYFDILGIDKALLLPVAPATGTMDEQMDASFRMFKGDDRFRLAGAVPNTVRNEDVASYLKGQVEDYGIVAVKIHPNVTKIDLAAPEGKERVECIVAASGGLGLPVVIHGGRSEILGDANAHFAEMSNLADIDFQSPSPVIIAHGGAYGMTPAEVDDEVVPALKKLLRAYGNVHIDISGLNESAIVALLTNVEPERVLFGSDALYASEIAMGMRLLYALERTGVTSDDALIRILSENAARTIFREDSRKVVSS